MVAVAGCAVGLASNLWQKVDSANNIIMGATIVGSGISLANRIRKKAGYKEEALDQGSMTL